MPPTTYRSSPPAELAGSSRSTSSPAPRSRRSRSDRRRSSRRVVPVLVVPGPPAAGLGLGIAVGRVLPRLLPPEGGDVEVAEGAAERLVTAAVDEVGPEDPVAVAEEHVGSVPLVHAEVGVEAIGQRVPGGV